MGVISIEQKLDILDKKLNRIMKDIAMLNAHDGESMTYDPETDWMESYEPKYW